MDILDRILAAEMANEYTDSKGGYTKGLTLTYDGNKEGKDVYVDLEGTTYIRIGNVIDTHTIATVALNDAEIPASKLEFASFGGADVVLYSGVIGIYVFANGSDSIPAGTYVLDDGEYVINKVVTETIVPINPKFIPGYCLPVVELSTELSQGVLLTEEESKALTDCIGLPCIIKMADSFATLYSYAYDGQHCFISNESYVLVQVDDGTWGCAGTP